MCQVSIIKASLNPSCPGARSIDIERITSSISSRLKALVIALKREFFRIMDGISKNRRYGDDVLRCSLYVCNRIVALAACSWATESSSLYKQAIEFSCNVLSDNE